MAILIDADVVIQSARGLFDLDAWLNSHPLEEFRLAAITLAELWHGTEPTAGVDMRTRRLFLERISASFEVVPYTTQTAFAHARLWAALELTGQMLGSVDLILAATAIQTGNAVATFNRRRFAAVKGLNLVEPV
jgi:tRNA(fMet)-specific endonuclease VapC